MTCDEPLKSASFHEGPNWYPRKGSMEDDINEGFVWSNFSADSEWGCLRDVALYVPGKKTHIPERDPDTVLHLDKVNYQKLGEELIVFARILEKNGVNVHYVSDDFPGFNELNLFNQFYVKDQFFMTRAGAIVGRMGSMNRRGEEKLIARLITSLGIPICASIGGEGTFEGADAVWLNPNKVLVGVGDPEIGNRTNKAGFEQVQFVLEKLQNVECVSVELNPKFQHLRGILQIVDEKLAFVRTALAPSELLSLLKVERFRVIEIGESEEILPGQAMNFVVVRPMEVIMVGKNDVSRKLFERHGILVLGEVDGIELKKAGGGLACAAGILNRDRVQE